MSESLSDPNGIAAGQLREIVANYGARALDDPGLLTRILPDLMSEQPRERRVVEAAATAGVADRLTTRISHGASAPTAIADVARLLSDQHALTLNAATWVVTAYAHALGHTTQPTPQAEAPEAETELAPTQPLANPRSPEPAQPVPGPQPPAQHQPIQPQSAPPAQPLSPAAATALDAAYSTMQQATAAPQWNPVSAPPAAPQWTPVSAPPVASVPPAAHPQQYPPGPQFGPPPTKPGNGKKMLLLIGLPVALVLAGVCGVVGTIMLTGSDECMVGKWEMISANQYLHDPDRTIPYTGSGTLTVVFKADGTGSMNNDKVVYDQGDGWKTIETGHFDYRYTATETEVKYTGVTGSNDTVWRKEGEADTTYKSENAQLTSDQVSCADDRMVLTGGGTNTDADGKTFTWEYEQTFTRV